MACPRLAVPSVTDEGGVDSSVPLPPTETSQPGFCLRCRSTVLSPSVDDGEHLRLASPFEARWSAIVVPPRWE